MKSYLTSLLFLALPTLGCSSGSSSDTSIDASQVEFLRSDVELWPNHPYFPLTPGTLWIYEGENNDIYQTEHNELFASIRKGKPINNGEYMSKSTLLAIMGRMATYTGQEITWEQALNSKEVLGPKAYEWGKAPPVVIARPGITRFS